MTTVQDGNLDSGEITDVLYKRPGFLLRRAHQITVSLFVEASGELNTTTTQFGVLTLLRHHDGLDQIGLARKAGLDRSTTGLVVKKLESNGLVVRVDDPKDRRRKVIVLTAKGERLLERLRGPAAIQQQTALSVFEPEEARQFVSLLEKFVSHFNDKTRAPIILDEK